MITNKYNHYNVNKNSIFLEDIKLSSKKNSIKREWQIKKMQLDNTNKKIAHSLLQHQVRLHWHQINTIQRRTKLQQILKNMRRSGFFYSIKILELKNAKQYWNSIILTIKINPILKKIHIKNYKKLQIPSYLLYKTFESQIGLPKNYHILNKSIQKIYTWYISRGFEFIDIKLINQEISNDIFIEINEGAISNVEFFCKTNSLLKHDVIYNLNKLIRQEININSGNILNTKRLILSLINLKKLHFFHNFNYTVKNEKDKIQLRIYYHILDSSKFFLYFKHQFIKDLNYFTNIKDDRIKNLKTKLRFYYRSINFRRYIDYFIMHGKLTIPLQEYNLYLFKHLLSIEKQIKIISILITHFSKTLDNIKLFYPKIIIKKKIASYKQIINLQAKLYNIDLTFKHQLIYCINIIEKLCITYYSKNTRSLYINNRLISNKYKLKNYKHNTLYNIKKYKETIELRMVYIKIALKYNFLYLIESTPIGKFIDFHSQLFTILIPNINIDICKIEYLGQYIKYKYIHYFYIPNVLPYIYKNIIMCLFEANVFSSQAKALPNYLNNYPGKLGHDCSSTINTIKYFYYTFRIEWHIYKIKYASIYVFYNFTNQYDMHKSHEHIVTSESSKYIIKNQGLGIQFNIPIKNLTNIKIEYNKNIQNEYSLKINNNPKYS